MKENRHLETLGVRKNPNIEVTPMSKKAFIFIIAATLFSPLGEAARLWQRVPGFPYVVVDATSIHRERPPLPPRDDHHLRPPDTIADVKIDGRTYPKETFWCVPEGQVQFGPFGQGWTFDVWPPNPAPHKGRFTKVAMDAVEHVVCVDLEKENEMPTRRDNSGSSRVLR